MQTDSDLFRQMDAQSRPRTIVRFYEWEKGTVSLGKHQRAEAACDVEYCRRQGIPVVKRPTGGRAVYHEHELTYAIASNDADLFPLKSLMQTYLLIAQGLQRGLEILGVSTRLAQNTLRAAPPFALESQNPCFVAPSRYELVNQGRKIAGSAQRRGRRAFLQHGSLPLSVDYDEMAAALRADAELLRSTVISVSEAAGQEVERAGLEKALRVGFETTVFRSTNRSFPSRHSRA